jgi:hypothetical protein
VNKNNDSALHLYLSSDNALTTRQFKRGSKMNDQTKLALFDALKAYLFQSSSAMKDSIKALVLDPLLASRVDVLNDALDSARVLLSKVNHHFII